MSGYTLAVDYGTTFTVGVVTVGGASEILEFDNSRYLPSMVLLGPDGGLAVGRSALNQAGRYPDRVAATPKREIGRPGLLLGDETVPLPRAVGAVLARVAEEAARRFNGAGPARLILTHPAAWAEERLMVLQVAAAEAGLREPELVAEPVAAAAHYADGSLAPGSHVAVYDLGGGTFDVAVLRRTADGFEVAGVPGGDPRLGGEDFDHQLRELVEEHAAERDRDGYEAARAATGSSARRERLTFRREVREAKHALSDDMTYLLNVPGVEEPVHITRAELNQLIGPDLRKTVGLLQKTIADARLEPGQLSAVYLTGGSSRIPLVSTLVAEALGLMPTTQGDPKAVVAQGAVHAATGSTTRPSAPGHGAPAGGVSDAETQSIEDRSLARLTLSAHALLRIVKDAEQSAQLFGERPRVVLLADKDAGGIWGGSLSCSVTRHGTEIQQEADALVIASVAAEQVREAVGQARGPVSLVIAPGRVLIKTETTSSALVAAPHRDDEAILPLAPDVQDTVGAVLDRRMIDDLRNRLRSVDAQEVDLAVTPGRLVVDGAQHLAYRCTTSTQSGRLSANRAFLHMALVGIEGAREGLVYWGPDSLAVLSDEAACIFVALTRPTPSPDSREHGPAEVVDASREIDVLTLTWVFRLTTHRIVVKGLFGDVKCDRPLADIAAFTGEGDHVRVWFADGQSVKVQSGLLYKTRALKALEQVTGKVRQP